MMRKYFIRFLKATSLLTIFLLIGAAIILFGTSYGHNLRVIAREYFNFSASTICKIHVIV